MFDLLELTATYRQDEIIFDHFKVNFLVLLFYSIMIQYNLKITCTIFFCLHLSCKDFLPTFSSRRIKTGAADISLVWVRLQEHWLLHLPQCNSIEWIVFYRMYFKLNYARVEPLEGVTASLYTLLSLHL